MGRLRAALDYFTGGTETMARGNVYAARPIGSPEVTEWLRLTDSNESGESVTERSALTFPAVWRAVSLISGTGAALPLKVYRTGTPRREITGTVLDDPGRLLGLTPYAWKRLCLVHKLLHGEAFLRKLTDEAGNVVGLEPVHPLAVDVELDPLGRKAFLVHLQDGTAQLHDGESIIHDMGMSADGIRGLSPLRTQSNAIGAGLGANRAAARVFRSGMLLGGILSSSDPTMAKEDGDLLIQDLRRRATGAGRAGDVVFINRALNFAPWSMSARDGQLLESRAMQVEEVARIYGLPPHLLAISGAVSNWGTGVAEQNRQLGRFTLLPYLLELAEALRPVVPRGAWAEWEMAGLFAGDPADEIRLLLDQVDRGLLTLNEAREIRNLPPLPGGDTPRALPGTDVAAISSNAPTSANVDREE